MINCIAFDMDDTLYDEIDYYKSGFAVVAQTIADDFGLSGRGVFDILWEIFNSGNYKTTLNAAAEKLGVVFDAAYIEKLVKVFREHKPDIKLSPESREVLESLKSRYKLGLITDGYLPAQEYKVKALTLEKFFDYIVYTEKLGREHWKPSPTAFEKLLAEFGVLANQCVYVGDNLKKDFLSPNQMGFKTVRIIRPKRIHLGQAPSKQAQPGYEIDSINKLPDLLKEIEIV
ncbi:MAG: HAD family hydrolase [Planctomycetes bacterium]|nr:HAD family hydrolase [Planctomycetota bacterium]MBU2458557.1 HAD family hydrolase [Planctomycetota bacterium]MBU2596804.1 HAD family hydrolase [Planctomycetota bacterium]